MKCLGMRTKVDPGVAFEPLLELRNLRRLVGSSRRVYGKEVVLIVITVF